MTGHLSDRIGYAQAALDCYRELSQQRDADLQEAVIDLIADIQHLLNEAELDLGYVFDLAKAQFDASSAPEYDGWNTRETRVVHFWLTRDTQAQTTCLTLASEAMEKAEGDSSVVNGLWSCEDAAKFDLACQLCKLAAEAAPIAERNLFSDLLRQAFEFVDWHQIAGSFLARL